MLKKSITAVSTILAILFVMILSISAYAADETPIIAPYGNWWDVVPEDEVSAPNYDSILYSEIAPLLHEIDMASDRVKVEVIGQSAGGRNLFLVTVSSPDNIKWLKRHKRISRMMPEQPEKILSMMDNGYDVKVPVFINGSIHGNEYEGTDACIRLIQTLANENSDEVLAMLDSMIILFNVCQNPDGRVLGTRQNSNYIDINRDFISQTQPEARATVKVIAEWNPMIFLDLHDDVDPMLIEPCSPPHNQNYEYDLYIKWAFYQAEAMEAELKAQTGFDAQIPYRDWDFDAEGYYWDDWPPIYTPMYAMYHGSYGHTLETPYEDERGVDADYAAVWGALNFVMQNKTGMIQDQINIFWRGDHAKPQQLISDELLAESSIDQFNEFTIKEFPAAYIIPAGGPAQLSTHQPAKLIDFLIFNDVEVEKATASFTLDGVVYPAGTYIVRLDQPKRGLANAILEDGPDVSDLSEMQENMVFYSPPTAWSNPLLWGIHRVVTQENIAVNTVPVKKATPPEGSFESGGAAYAYLPTTIAAIQATNTLLKGDVMVYRTQASFEDAGRAFGTGTFIISGDASVVNMLADTYALELFALSEIPDDAILLKPRRIAVNAYKPNGLPFSLKYLGFDYDMISTDDLNAGKISEYDLFINSTQSWDNLTDDGRAALTAFFENNGDYIGIGNNGVGFGVDAGLSDAAYKTEWDPDCILKLNFSSEIPIAAGFREDDYALAVGLVYFTAVSENTKIAASVDADDFLAAGFWPGWQESGANGKPVVIYETAGTRDVTLMGIDPTFRGYTENTFRLLANAIYSGS